MSEIRLISGIIYRIAGIPCNKEDSMYYNECENIRNKLK